MRDFAYARCREAGNILFYILIAVALFAALSYAVTQSSRGGSKDASDEINALHAAEIVQYTSQIEQTITRLRIIDGCTATENTGNTLSFQYDSDGDGDWNDSDEAYYNSNAPTDHSCHVFHPNGGGIAWRDMPYGTGWQFNGLNGIVDVGACDNAWVADCMELMAILRNVDKQLCMEMNDDLGITNLADGPPIDGGYGDQFYVGNFVGGPLLGDDVNSTRLAGTYAGCFEDESPAGYHFYYVLIAR